MRTITRDIVGAFIISADKKILLGQSSKGGVYQDVWTVPGGGIEPGETREEAVIREVLEEVGVDIRNFKRLELNEPGNGKSEKIIDGDAVMVEMTFYDFVAISSLPASAISFKASDDFKIAKWFDLDALENQEITDAMHKKIPEVIEACL